MKEASKDNLVDEDESEEEIKNMVMSVTLDAETINLVERYTSKGLTTLL